MDAQVELEALRARIALQERVDAALEEATAQRLPLAETLALALPIIGAALGADAAWVDTLDEELAPRTFGWAAADQARAGARPRSTERLEPVRVAKAVEPARTSIDPALVAKASAAARSEPAGASLPGPDGALAVLSCCLDVAGDCVGTLGVRLRTGVDASGAAAAHALLHAAAEELDDHIARIHEERRKQRLLRQIHDALRHPLVHEGVRIAVERIAGEVQFDLLMVLYHLREDDQQTVHYVVFRGPALEFGPGARLSQELDRVLRRGRMTRAGGAQVLVSNAEVEHRRLMGDGSLDLGKEGESASLLESLGFQECIESVLIAGLDDEAVVGKLVVATKRPLGTFERDVLRLFADVLQKRIVDYNEVGEALRRTFPLPTVVRLLDEERPYARLAPRSADVSLLYADVAGFTALSERHLREPQKIGAFVDVWSRGVTRILWEHGGVFDKIVGDCIIGLFGPPFFEMAAADRAVACARTAAAMVRFTQQLIDHPACAPIKEANAPLGVAIGLNDGPSSVGSFGAGQDYTAFSSAMNNTARLQGMSTRDEVLVMAPMKELIESAGLGIRFGPRREGKAKNVAEPLVFYALDLDSVPPLRG